MRSRTIYRNKDGKIIKLSCNEVAPCRRNETVEDFDTRMRKTLYQLECAEGSRFRIPGYSNSTVKRVWEHAAERQRAGGS